MMARAAVIGPEVHANVTELVAGGMSKSDAFKQVAKERKSSAGTVSANYYRVQRQRRSRSETARCANWFADHPESRGASEPRVGSALSCATRAERL
jgi:hypothetical protein